MRGIRNRWVIRIALCAVVLIATVTTPAFAQSETIEYYGLDALGSVRAIFDQQGNVLGRMDYGPFGENLRAAIKFPTEQFAQLTRDAESGQDYAEVRNYDFDNGRFTRPDAVYRGFFLPQKWNRYTYALNAPVTYLDVNGKDPFIAAGVTVAGFLAAAKDVGALDPNRSTVVTGNAGEEFKIVVDGTESLTVDWVGNDGWLDKAQAALDISSIGLDLTGAGAAISPAVDAINGLISLGRGDLTGAAMSGMAAVPFLGSVANATRVGRWKLTRTVSGHLDDVTRAGNLARPYLTSPHTIEEIMRAAPPIPDPGGLAGALRWDVPGSFAGKNGVWELVVDPNTNTILHFLFTGR